MVDYSPTATIIIKYPTERGRTTEMFGGVTAGCRSEKLKKTKSSESGRLLRLHAAYHGVVLKAFIFT